jgi:hypothetical protein
MLLPARLRVLKLRLPLIALMAATTQPVDALSNGDEFKRDKDIVVGWNFQDMRGDHVPNEAPGGMHGRNHGAECVDGAMVFDGMDDYVSIRPHRKIASLSKGTISVWFKFDSIPYGEQNVQPIFYFGDADGGADNASLIIEIGHFWDDIKVTTLYFTILGVPGQKPTFCFDSNLDLMVDTWYHFVAVVGESFNTGYLDGVELVNRNYNFGGPNDSVFFKNVPNVGMCFIGKGYFANFPNPCYFDGAIDDVRIYRKPLDAANVAHLFWKGRSKEESKELTVTRRSIAGASSGNSAASLEIRRDPGVVASRIRMSLSERTSARLQIFGVDGRLVSTLLNEEVGPGTREVTWNGRDGSGRPVASGAYFCRLETSGSMLARKLILCR